MSKFAKTPEEYVRRLGELSKSEIRVLLGLLLNKNQTTGRCNPKQVAIARAIGMSKSHVSEALAGLEEKRWAIQDDTGNFLFPESPPEVPESGTFRNAEQKVPESGTKVPESGTSLNKVLKQTKQQRIEQRGTRIPDPFLLTAEMRSYAAERRPDIDMNIETEKFCNYWRSKPGQGARKLDWVATWRNWILNAKGGRRSELEVLQNGQIRLSAAEKRREELARTHNAGENVTDEAVARIREGLSAANPTNVSVGQLPAGHCGGSPDEGDGVGEHLT